MEEVHPEKVFLTGGGALYPGMGAMLQDFLGLPVELVDLAQTMGVDMEEGASEHWNPLLMNSALALAIRHTKDDEGFDFRLGEFRKRKRYDQLVGEIRKIAVYAAIILFVLVADIYADYYVIKKRHNHLQEEITAVFKKTFPDAKRIVDPAQQMKVKLREAKDSLMVPGQSFEQAAAVDLLRDIALRIPKTADVDVASLIIDQDRVRLKGLTDNFNTVDTVKNGLEGSDYFKDVAIASAQLDRTGDRVRFEVLMGRK